MKKGDFRFYVTCAVLIFGFLGFLGYMEIFAEESNTAEVGDQIVMDYSYTDTDDELQEITGSKYLIGSEDFTSTFDDAVVGVKKGDEKSIDVTYPDDYVDQTIAGESFTYDISVTKVMKCNGSEDVCLAQ